MRKLRFGIYGVQFLRIGCALYILLFGFESLRYYSTGENLDGVYLLRRKTFSRSEYEDYLHQNQNEIKNAPLRPYEKSFSLMEAPVQMNQTRNMTQIERAAMEAWGLGLKAWQDVEAYSEDRVGIMDRQIESCHQSIVISGSEFLKSGKLMLLPCGLRLGSSITLVGRPRHAYLENHSTISRSKEGDSPVMISQFILELQGLKAVDGEAPPRILHFNPRLKGDWSGRAVVEQNTCYRMQWGSEQRCEGLLDDETGMYAP